MDEYREEAGRRLRQLREHRGWSQEELAAASKLSVKTISRFENGKHDGRRGTLRALADALDTTEGDITGPPPAPLGLDVHREAPVDVRLGTVDGEMGDRLASMESELCKTNGLLRELVASVVADQEARREGPNVALTSALGRFSDAIEQQNRLLDKQTEVLERIEKAVSAEQSASRETQEATERLLGAVDVANRALRGGAPHPAAGHGPQAR